MASKLAMVVAEAMDSNAVAYTCLGVAFAGLAVRSDSQQKRVEALGREKDSLLNSIKSMRAMMWDWKQQLFAEAAAAAGTSVVVPLSTLKAIYSELPTSSSGDMAKAKGDTKSSAPITI